jgi:hypothetical protein
MVLCTTGYAATNSIEKLLDVTGVWSNCACKYSSVSGVRAPLGLLCSVCATSLHFRWM